MLAQGRESGIIPHGVHSLGNAWLRVVERRADDTARCPVAHEGGDFHPHALARDVQFGDLAFAAVLFGAPLLAGANLTLEFAIGRNIDAALQDVQTRMQPKLDEYLRVLRMRKEAKG